MDGTRESLEKSHDNMRGTSSHPHATITIWQKTGERGGTKRELTKEDFDRFHEDLACIIMKVNNCRFQASRVDTLNLPLCNMSWRINDHGNREMALIDHQEAVAFLTFPFLCPW